MWGDLQLGIESYQTKINLERPNWDAADYYFKEDYTIVPKPRAVVYETENDQESNAVNELQQVSPRMTREEAKTSITAIERKGLQLRRFDIMDSVPSTTIPSHSESLKKTFCFISTETIQCYLIDSFSLPQLVDIEHRGQSALSLPDY
ncbi:hypothetical protein Tco_1067659 [Tanacetum coccineum]|uniref:Uncharacterized protein n=1 Tax=Tanacetum coccineum TaxID=301880 RepID=A0ABQ5HFE0_9ASTR